MNGVHVHHQVYGIFLLLGTGTAEFTRRNATGSRPDTPRRVSKEPPTTSERGG